MKALIYMTGSPSQEIQDAIRLLITCPHITHGGIWLKAAFKGILVVTKKKSTIKALHRMLVHWGFNPGGYIINHKIRKGNDKNGKN